MFLHISCCLETFHKPFNRYLSILFLNINTTSMQIIGGHFIPYIHGPPGNE